MITDIKKFIATFNRISQTKSEDIVFNDFLDMTICALSLGQYEEEYRSIVKKYNAKELDLFCELMADMLIIMDDDGKGFKDALGEFYQQRLSRGKHGQFFTPEHVCDFMAAITITDKDKGKNMLDPAAGSGRMLLAAAKISRHNNFFACEIDERLVKVTAINFCLNSLQGEVAWMNSLGGPEDHWGGYSISRTQAYPHIPVIRKLAAGEGAIIHSAPFNKKEQPKDEQQVAKDDNTIVIQTKLDL
jgi:type I restriction-modification system DNA methylase subunit